MIVFDASWETLEDTRLFFHDEIAEARASGESPGAVTTAVGVPAASLRADLSFTNCFRIRCRTIEACPLSGPRRPAVVHILHLREADEVLTHQRLSDRFSHPDIPMINPYTPGTAHCDSKFRTFEILKEAGIPTPDSWLVSRHNPNRPEALREIAVRVREADSGAGLYIQPDRGTGGRACFHVAAENIEEATYILNEPPEDTIVRVETGNVRYERQNPVFRINVCFDGTEFSADSGYCMVGGRVVAAALGAKRVDINRVIDSLGFTTEDVEIIREVCCAAVRAVFRDGVPALVVGVDVVIERVGPRHNPFILDLNPRPVVVGSRIIGAGGIGLGRRFWQGVCRL